MIAVIAAGGKGSRLSSLTIDIPKPMIRIAGKPILEHQIECLKENGITDIFILIGYLGNVIKDYFKDGKSFHVNIRYIEEKQPLGSGGSLYYLRNVIKDNFIFLFGDLMLSVSFDKMYKFHEQNHAKITLLAHPNSHPFDSDLVIVDKENLVTGFDSKHNKRNYCYHNLVNSGVYIISPKIFDDYFYEPKTTDFEKDIVLNEIHEKDVFAYITSEYVKDMGTIERFESVSSDLKNGIIDLHNLSKPQKCIFLDRDGTINVYKGFLSNVNDFELVNGVSSAIKSINSSQFLSICVTNQPVVARGDCSLEELNDIQKKMETLLGIDGAYLNATFVCVHHPDKGFEGEIKELKIECDCRKPKIGLLKQAQEQFNIDLSSSWMIGDTSVDVQTGQNAGCKTILLVNGMNEIHKKYDAIPDFVCNNISEAIDIILNEGE